MDLVEELAAFDGRRTDTLAALANRLEANARLIDELCALAGHEDINMQSAATWLLKRFQEDGSAFTSQQVGALLDLLARVASWDARLHLLQMLPAWEIDESACEPLAQTLERSGYLAAPNKFVRAWSYNAIAELAERSPALREKAAALLTAAERDEAASVRARIRAIVTAKPWVRMAGP